MEARMLALEGIYDIKNTLINGAPENLELNQYQIPVYGGLKLIREVNLLSYIPDFLKEYEEMKTIQEIMQSEIQRMEDESEVLFDNQFIMSSDLENIRRYEQMLHLQASSKDTLADRRFKVLSKWNRIIPYTKVTLRQRLAVLCGEDGYTLDISPDKKVIVKQTGF
jgi:hypothetical protein